MIRLGLISDTHGLLRPEAREFLQGSDLILHAGDIGNPGILEELRLIAPLTVVRGNNDKGPWASTIRDAEFLRIGEVLVYVVHDLAVLDLDPAAAGIRVLVSGHSHKPSVQERGGVLFVNPGSAGPRRFKLPVSVGEVIIDGLSASARTTTLEIRPAL